MRIQHNIPAMSAYRNYTNNVSALSKNLEKLSSGYKINRAGDDAAGLAISEKMRAQISGLEQAQNNAKSGINLVQTAEGSLTEVHDMLNRMVTLAEQSANGTYDNEVDRVQLQKEVSQLRDEINRIADSANFNGIKLLDGSMASATEAKGMEKVNVAAILDGVDAPTPAKTIFTLNLHGMTVDAPAGDWSLTIGGGDDNLLVKNDSTNSDGTADTDKFMSDITGGISGDELAKKIADNHRTFKLGGNIYNVELADAGILKFTSQENVALDSTIKVNLNGKDLTLTDDANDLVNDSSFNNGSGLAVTILQHGAPDNSGVLATGSFTLESPVDGTALTIGDETYVFAVGENSSFKDANNVVDLTKYTGKEDNFQNLAAGALSKAAENNKAVKVETGNNGKIYLTEKEGGLDRDKWDVYGPDNTNNADATWANFVKVGTASIKSTGMTLQIGDTAESFNQLKVSINDMHADAMGIGDINISTQAGAQDAMEKIKDAINYVSDVRGTLGATQNRLDHTINNLSVMRENIQDAESTIRDVDVAEEMMEYTKNNILVQSAQAMLAQANQLPQGVLQLLG